MIKESRRRKAVGGGGEEMPLRDWTKRSRDENAGG